MIRRKIWIAFSLIPLSAVFAQQNTKTQVTVQVTDVTGAPVPKATVEVASLPNAQTLKFETDAVGKAEFDLPPGNYDLHVKSQGFCPFRKFLEPLNEQNQVVSAKLQIDSCPGPCAGPCVTVDSESGNHELENQSVQASQDLLKVIVTDATGAVIQRANVEATSTLPDNFGGHWSGSTNTNTLGEAPIDLQKGIYDISVSANGFRKWSTEIEFGAHPNQAIRAKLDAAQQASTGRLTIRVADQSGAVIPGARVVVGQTAPNPWFSAIANSSGDVAFEAAPGNYDLLVTAHGFKPWNQGLVVGADSNQSILVTLAINPLVECGPCPSLLEIHDLSLTSAPEPTSLTLFIPLEGLRSLDLVAAPPHKRHR